MTSRGNSALLQEDATNTITPPFALAPNELDQAAEFDRGAFGAALTRWFGRAQRDLPWRRENYARHAYPVLVSEVMLQQTTVAAVVPYFERFLHRFPTFQALANASIDEVLPFWAGLGYYSRARNLHALARAVVEGHDGRFPAELQPALALPGIGRYTAGAVLSIAFDLPIPIVDANVARVLSRVFLIEGDLKTAPNQTRLWRQADILVRQCSPNPADFFRPRHLNPALMELGALVCTPRAPDCPACPVAAFCGARAAGRQNELPMATPRPVFTDMRDACLWIEDGDGRILLRRRPDHAKIWWRGMWELPRTTAEPNESTRETALRSLAELGLAATVAPQPIHSLKHTVTHHHIILDCYRANLGDGTATTELPAEYAWVSWDETESLALPAPMRRLLRRLEAVMK